jgi:hypothetical protein
MEFILDISFAASWKMLLELPQTVVAQCLFSVTAMEMCFARLAIRRFCCYLLQYSTVVQ